MKKRIVLLYHSIGKSNANDLMQLRIPKAELQKHVDFVRLKGMKISTIEELLSSKDDRSRVAFSFDDGYEDQIQAAEILEKAGSRGTFFVIPGLFGGKMPGAGCWNRWKLMSKGKILELSARGHEIGGHSLTHPGPLDQLAPIVRRREIACCGERLEELLGRDITGFSYPHGGISREVQRDVAEAGYRYACCSEPGTFRPGSNLYSIPRIEVRGRDSLKTFVQKISGQGEIWRKIRHHLSRLVHGIIRE